MPYISLFTFFAAVLLGFYVLFYRTAAAANRVFFVYCQLIALLAFANAASLFTRAAGQSEQLYFWAVIRSPWPFVLALQIHLVALLTGRTNLFRSGIFYPSVYALALLATVGQVVMYNLEGVPAGYTEGSADSARLQTMVALLGIMAVSAAVYSLYLCISWLRTVTDREESRRIVVVMIGVVIPPLWGVVSNVVLPAMGITLQGAQQMGTSLACLFLAWGVVRHRLLVLTPSMAAGGIVNALHEGILLIDTSLKIRLANPAALELLGCSGQNIEGRSLNEFLDLDTAVINKMLTGSVKSLNLSHGKNGTARELMISSAPVTEGPSKSRAGISVHLRDVTMIRQAEAKLRHLATHDALTGLPNRVLMADRFDQAIARLKRSSLLMAVMMIDLDNFKEINDRSGHQTGDEVLRHVSGQLYQGIREYDTVVRFGGDEFLLLLNNFNNTDEINDAARRLLYCLQAPMSHGHEEIRVTASIGVAIAPKDGLNRDELLNSADQAMYRAKEEGLGICFYNAGMSSES